jgi:hypothetical protein
MTCGRVNNKNKNKDFKEEKFVKRKDFLKKE